MDIKLLKLKLSKMTKLNLKAFMKNKNSKNKILNEIDLKKVYNYPSYCGNSIITANKRFVKFNDGSMGGSARFCST